MKSGPVRCQGFGRSSNVHMASKETCVEHCRNLSEPEVPVVPPVPQKLRPVALGTRSSSNLSKFLQKTSSSQNAAGTAPNPQFQGPSPIPSKMLPNHLESQFQLISTKNNSGTMKPFWNAPEPLRGPFQQKSL